jgi:putative ABC transport system permease protein
MAPRDVINALSRTGVAIAALMVAVSVTIGVSLMVGSFRYTVITWLEETLQGDVYISAPGLAAAQASIPLDSKVLPIIQDWPGVRRADVLRSAMVDSPSGPVHIAATNNPTLVDERIFLSASGGAEEMRKALDGGAILVSEPLANRLGLIGKGNAITLFTEMGAYDFPTTGIYYDYASTQGTVLMTLSTYRKYWNDTSLTAASLRLDMGADPDQVADDLAKALKPVQRLQIRPNQALREEVLVVFDRTFAITGALQILAMIVAFVGILSALLSLELERQRELGILRAIGLTTRQLWSLVMVETGLMGGVAGLLAMPTGFVLAVILIYIINRRSFGWTLQMQVEPTPFLQAIGVAIVAALLAGIYPALKISRTVTSEALRSE